MWNSGDHGLVYLQLIFFLRSVLSWWFGYPVYLVIHLLVVLVSVVGLGLGKGKHSLLQVCLNLQDKGVDLLCLTETNVNWKRHHLVQRFSVTLKKAWINRKISICTSDSSLPWNSNYKPGETVIIALGEISSAIIAKRRRPIWIRKVDHRHPTKKIKL